MTEPTRDRKKCITWDESGIREHDKERGTRMKIYEVSTPFIYTTSDLESDDDANSRDNDDIASELINRLNIVKTEADRKAAFLEHRKKHYDEFKTLKALERVGKIGCDEEDDLENENEPCGGVNATNDQRNYGNHDRGAGDSYVTNHVGFNNINGISLNPRH